MSSEVEQRIAGLEARLESAFALDARLKTLESDLRKVKGGSTVRDWLSTLAPYIGGLILLFVGFWIKDKVTLALQRESLDLQYVQQMRDLIRDFNAASDSSAANANAMTLALYGKYAIAPLVRRLDENGDVGPLAAAEGLAYIGSNDPVAACPKFVAIINDQGRHYGWQTHRSLIRILGQSLCRDALPDLKAYRLALKSVEADAAALAKFAHDRYKANDYFDVESAGSILAAIDVATEVLTGTAAEVER